MKYFGVTIKKHATVVDLWAEVSFVDPKTSETILIEGFSQPWEAKSECEKLQRDDPTGEYFWSTWVKTNDDDVLPLDDLEYTVV
jgi:hypothetical protein